MYRYLSNREEREEGGTPNVLGDVKLGLVVHLKQLIGTIGLYLVCGKASKHDMGLWCVNVCRPIVD